VKAVSFNNFLKAAGLMSQEPQVVQARVVLEHHCVILGSTQTGKTTTSLKLLQDQPGLKLFINTKHDRNFEKYFRFIVGGLEQVKRIVKEYEYENGMICFNPPFRKPYKEVESLCEWLIFDYHKPKGTKSCVVVDEAHVFVKKEKQSLWLRRLWTMGLGLGVRAVAISQRGQMFRNSLEIPHNSEYYIIHALKDHDLKYLVDHGYISGIEGVSFPASPHSHGRKFCEISHEIYVQTNNFTGLRRVQQ
jgi:hypothetical protein